MAPGRTIEDQSDRCASAHDRVTDVVTRRSSRYTKVQRKLVAFMAGCSRPLTVAELSEAAELPASSVYRNARRLLDAGVLVNVRGPGPVERFELDAWVLGREHHHHLLCTGCGVVADYEAPAAVERALDEALPGIERDFGFTVHRHIVDLVGMCRACQDRDRRRP